MAPEQCSPVLQLRGISALCRGIIGNGGRPWPRTAKCMGLPAGTTCTSAGTSSGVQPCGGMWGAAGCSCVRECARVWPCMQYTVLMGDPPYMCVDADPDPKQPPPEPALGPDTIPKGRLLLAWHPLLPPPHPSRSLSLLRASQPPSQGVAGSGRRRGTKPGSLCPHLHTVPQLVEVHCL